MNLYTKFVQKYNLSWRKGLIGFIFAIVFLLVLSPELVFFSFLLDAAVIDVMIILTGIQIKIYWEYLRMTAQTAIGHVKAFPGKVLRFLLPAKMLRDPIGKGGDIAVLGLRQTDGGGDSGALLVDAKHRAD